MFILCVCVCVFQIETGKAELEKLQKSSQARQSEMKEVCIYICMNTHCFIYNAVDQVEMKG